MSCLTMSSLQKARQPAKRIFILCLPHALLCITYLLYLIFGTIVFLTIEGSRSSELENYGDTVADLRKQLEDAMWNESHGIHHNSTNWTKMLDEYTDMVSRPEWKLGRLRAAQDGIGWSFTSTMLFCLITITTIGYGDIIPVTRGGRIFVGFYASFGIPLNVIFLADVGFLLAKLIIATMQIYKTCRHKRKNSGESSQKMIVMRPPPRGMWTTDKKKTGEKKRKPLKISGSRFMSVHGPRSVMKETSSPMQSPIVRGKGGEVIMASSKLSVHGPKPIVICTSDCDPKVAEKHMSLYPELQDTSFIEDEQGHNRTNGGFQSVKLEVVPPDLTINSSALNLMDGEQSPNRSRLDEKPNESSTDDFQTKVRQKSGIKINTQTAEEISGAVVEMDMDMMDEEDVDHTEVPLVVVLFILTFYVLFGSLLMVGIEDWEYGESVYFTFITLTTIGFGDMVPDNHYRKELFFVCIIYIVLGLSVMSTCIALVQAKVLRGVDKLTKWIHSFCDE